MTKEIRNIILICQINVEGLRRSKNQHVSKFLLNSNIDMAIHQETNIENEEQQFRRGKIHGYDLFGANYHCSYVLLHMLEGI